MVSLRNSSFIFSLQTWSLPSVPPVSSFLPSYQSPASLPLFPFFLHILSSSLSLLSLFFFSLFFYLIFPPLLLFSFSTHEQIQVRYNFELYYWTSNQKDLLSWNRTWVPKLTSCSHVLTSARFYSEDQICDLPKTQFRPQETVSGKSTGLKSDIFCFSL